MASVLNFAVIFYTLNNYIFNGGLIGNNAMRCYFFDWFCGGFSDAKTGFIRDGIGLYVTFYGRWAKKQNAIWF